MTYLLTTILLFFSINLHADYDPDVVEISGKVSDFNEDYVTLIGPKKVKAYAPRKAVSDEELKSSNRITVYAFSQDYFRIVKIISAKQKKR